MSNATSEISATGPETDAGGLRPELQQIITEGRLKPSIGHGSLKAATSLTLSSLILLWLSFTPLQISVAAWLALVPLIQLVRLKSLPAKSTWMLWCLGTIWSLATLQWMRLGHPTMYGALLALSLYVGLYLPAFVRVSRAVHKAGVPVWLGVPIVWTAFEFLRAHLLTGFSWYYLGHSQYRWSALTQISDITGAYGVSFLVALASSAIAVQVPLRWLQRVGLDVAASQSQPRFVPAVVAVGLLGATCAYGEYRLKSERPERPGPVFALIQGNFTPDQKQDRNSILERYHRHEELTQYARELQPDFIVWPETMFPWPMRVVADDVTDEQLLETLPSEYKSQPGSDRESLISFWRDNDVASSLSDHARITGAAMIVGLETWKVSQDGLQIFNSAAFLRPDTGYAGRFDKMHLVVFGEYIPLRDLFPWLASFTPYGSGFGLTPGDAPQLFEYAGFTIAPLICFEDTVPHVTRRVVRQNQQGATGPDVLVNLTNDAWFRGSSELDQHLITASFRCIETRRPLVRAVNGGISAFIDGDGRIREPNTILVADADSPPGTAPLETVEGMVDPATGRWRRQFNGIVVGQVPLDGRSSFYVQSGDWFCWICAGVTMVACAIGWRRRRSHKRADEPS